MWAHLLVKSVQFLLSIRSAVLLMYSSQVKVVSVIEERKNTSRSFPRSWLITGFVTRLTRRISLVEQELPTLQEHLSSPSLFSGVRATRSLDLYVCFVDRFLLLYFFVWPLCCLFFFDIRSLIASLVSSNSSCSL